MSDTPANQLTCTHCGYDLTSINIDPTSGTICPECGVTTSPYDPLAKIAQRTHPFRTFLLGALIWFIPGLITGLVFSIHFLLIVLLTPLLYPPTRLVERQLHRSIQRQRTIATIMITIGSLAGFILGFISIFTVQKIPI